MEQPDRPSATDIHLTEGLLPVEPAVNAARGPANDVDAGSDASSAGGVSNLRSRLTQLLQGSPWLRIIAGLLVGALVIWLVEPLGSQITLGSIVVDTPEIYTRERLVNDRFLQDAWLSRELEREKVVAGNQMLTDRRNLTIRMQDAEPQSSAGPNSPRPDNPGPSLSTSSRDRLLEELDYRDLVRNLAIENQLDDRHDINANSLYKLKFDVSVLPGANTQASARIDIRLMPPPFLSGLKNSPLRAVSMIDGTADVDSYGAWKKIYLKWVESLSSRLNQTQQELKHAYENNEFAHNDYARLIAFLSRNLKVTLTERMCAPEAAALRGGQDEVLTRLSTKDHIERKACIGAIVEWGIPKVSNDLDNESPVGKYVTPRQSLQAQDGTSSRETLDHWLNSYFATKTVQLVLGLSVPEGSFVGNGYYALPAFQSLVQLTFFNPFQKSPEENVFTVKERVAAIAAIDTSLDKAALDAIYKRDEQYWSQIHETGGTLQWSELEDFSATRPDIRLKISAIDLKGIEADDVELRQQDFKDVSGGRGLHVAMAEVGLLNFIRQARKQARAHTYAVTPKDSSDSVTVVLENEANVAAGTPARADGSGAGVHGGRATLIQSVERKNAVVGFSTATSNGNSEFGWLISPRHRIFDGQKPVLIQPPGQYALSALVSLPSWWNEARLEITTRWIGRDGTVQVVHPVVDHIIDIPTDFEPLEAHLLGIEQLGPELMESRLDPISLTACHSGAILIPGRRLWRSTKVTLGYQTAESISVLPNMKGIIAKFPEVWNQMSVREAGDRQKDRPFEIHRIVRVWTSQGSLTLPAPARIGIPPDCLPPKERKS